MKKIFTLCIVQNKERMLLGMKKRGFGKGRWNGFGGKVRGTESIEEAMKRELEEEAGLVPVEFEKKGVLEFRFQDDSEALQVHLFRIENFTGEPQETEEMKSQWFSLQDIPFEEMWPDDKFWFPLFLEGKKFQGNFLFKDENTILEHVLEEVDSLV
tara:strand:- start:36 stop:503 length:468 start_codon:yes stop_codon:yes gene_type:complete